MYKRETPNPSRPNAPIGRHQRIGYGVSKNTSTTPNTVTKTMSNGKSATVRTRSSK
jgi:hypothetical protein